MKSEALTTERLVLAVVTLVQVSDVTHLGVSFLLTVVGEVNLGERWGKVLKTL